MVQNLVSGRIDSYGRMGFPFLCSKIELVEALGDPLFVGDTSNQSSLGQRLGKGMDGSP